MHKRQKEEECVVCMDTDFPFEDHERVCWSQYMPNLQKIDGKLRQVKVRFEGVVEVREIKN